MASVHTNPASTTFYLASDDEFSQQETANGLISDLSTVKDFSKDFLKSKMSRPYVPTAVHNHPVESLCQETISSVEQCMKRHTGDLMRFLEGISSRISQLELYCFNVDKSVGKMRSNMGGDYEETDSKLKSLEKQLVEVGRSVQILRDKQELAEAKKELGKLQLAKNEISSAKALRPNFEQSLSPTLQTSEIQNQHLAIVLHHQGGSRPHSPPIRPAEIPQPAAPSQMAPQNVMQPQQYYLQVQPQVSKSQYFTSDTQHQTSQPRQQDINLVRLPPVSAHLSQQAPPPTQVHRFIQYHHRFQQPLPMYQTTQLPTRLPPTPEHSRPSSAPGYPSQPTQRVQQAPQETVPGSIHMHTTFSNISSLGTASVDVPNGYCGRQMQQPFTQQLKTNIGAPLGNVCVSVGQHQSLSPATYMMYRNEEAARQPSHQSQGYPPAPYKTLPQRPQNASVVSNHSQPKLPHNHHYNDQIEKLVNMGFRADHVVDDTKNGRVRSDS